MAVLGLVLLMAAVWGLSRVWPVPAAQRQALAALQPPPAPAGRDGFAQLWLLAHDGPGEEGRAALLAEDVARWQHGTPDQRAGVAAGNGQLPRLDMPGGSRCGARGVGCLAQVRAAPERFAAAHHGHEGLHARVAGLAAYERFSTPFQPAAGDGVVPLPALLPLLDPAAAHALAFVRGDTGAALRGACEGILSGRRLVHGSDVLITSMAGAAMVETNARLLADMLAALPPTQALPAACDAALQPMSVAEQDICPALRGEFAISAPWQDASAVQRLAGWLVFDAERTRLRQAPYYAWACGARARQALAEDRPLPMPPPPGRDIACLANQQGCVLADIGSAAMQPYAARSQDAAAMLRLVAAQRWLRQQPGPADQALARLPAALRSATRVPALAADGQALQVPRRTQGLQAQAGPLLSVPLPAAADGP